MAASNPIMVIGIGNWYRFDDGVGPFVARMIKEMKLEGVEVVETVADGAALVETWDQARAVFIIDATLTGATPGQVIRIDGFDEKLAADSFAGFSTHSFGLAESIKLGKTLAKLPVLLVIYGIEGKNYAKAIGLSNEVAKSARKVARRIKDEISKIKGDPGSDAAPQPGRPKKPRRSSK